MSRPSRVPMRPSGHAKLMAEFKDLKENQRPANVAAIEEARAHGDLSENAEYQYAKEKQGMIQAHIVNVGDMLSRAQVIDPSTLDLDRVAFGATVELLDKDTDDELTYTIVGSEEADAKNGLVSYDSPLARALMGKEEGDHVKFRAPRGVRHFEVIGIEYS